jgi:hypothetical protein
MNPDLVDVSFVPSGVVPAEDRDRWCRTAAAVMPDNGSLSIVFSLNHDGTWTICGFVWRRPGDPYLGSAPPDDAAPHRQRVIEVLRAAGLNVKT